MVYLCWICVLGHIFIRHYFKRSKYSEQDKPPALKHQAYKLLYHKKGYFGSNSSDPVEL